MDDKDSGEKKLKKVEKKWKKSLTNWRVHDNISKSLEQRPAKEATQKKLRKSFKKFLTNLKTSDIIDKHVWRDIEVVITRRS